MPDHSPLHRRSLGFERRRVRPLRPGRPIPSRRSELPGEALESRVRTRSGGSELRLWSRTWTMNSQVQARKNSGPPTRGVPDPAVPLHRERRMHEAPSEQHGPGKQKSARAELLLRASTERWLPGSAAPRKERTRRATPRRTTAPGVARALRRTHRRSGSTPKPGSDDRRTSGRVPNEHIRYRRLKRRKTQLHGGRPSIGTTRARVEYVGR